MSTIYEIFGYRLADSSPEAQMHRANAWCPFMDSPCDGGGNRYSTTINLSDPEYQKLHKLYPDRKTLVPGVCLLKVSEIHTPWIVCPRRLMVMGKENADIRRWQKQLEVNVVRLCGYPSGTRLGIWSEVKLKYKETANKIESAFDYTFDYVLMPVFDTPVFELAAYTYQTVRQLTHQLTSLGYEITADGTVLNVPDPDAHPSIVEIMTSSTSGQNRAKETTIAQAFQNALVHGSHTAPGINYRQVWSRMVSQLFVKSEVGRHWGGVTIWVLQDLLMHYIGATTRLKIDRHIRQATEDINILTFGYVQSDTAQGVDELAKPMLYAGLFSKEIEESNMTDIVRAKVLPPKKRLIETLLRRRKPDHDLLIV